MANTITVTNNTAEEVSFAVAGRRYTIAAGDNVADIPAKLKSQFINVIGELDVIVSDASDGGAGAQGPAGPQGPQGEVGPQGPAGADGASVTPAAFVPDAVGTTIAALRDEVNALKAALVAAGLMNAS